MAESDPWAKKTPEEILADVRACLEGIQAGPSTVEVNHDFYVAHLRTIKDPYQRLMMLYNAGCRGKDLR